MVLFRVGLGCLLYQGILLEPNDISPVLPEEVYESSVVSTILDYRGNEEDDEYYYDTRFCEKTATHHTYSCDGDTYTEAHEFEAYNYCYEKCRICDYERQIVEHDYTDHYTKGDSSGHYAYCICGARTTASHNYEEYLPCSTKCAQCGYKNEIGEHDYTHKYSKNYTYTDKHNAHCECGAFTLSDHTYQVENENGLLIDSCDLCGMERNHEHSYIYTSCGDGKNHTVSCDCGLFQYQQCFGMASDGNTGLVRCLKCNQRLSGNIIIPLEDDDDDENDVMFFKEDGIEEETE